MLLEEIESPIIMETHGGTGALFNSCYRGVEHGIVFEKDSKKVIDLAKQRPTWPVYEADCVVGISNGIGDHLAINFFDIDPHGSPWDAVVAIFDHWKYLPSKFAMAITDGQRQKSKLKDSWRSKQLQPSVALYGNDQIYYNYKEVCAKYFSETVATRGFTITKWTSYYCGHTKDITHFGAILERD